MDKVAQLCAEDAIGAVYTLPSGAKRLEALARTVATHRAIAGDEASVMADAGRYAGTNRVPATAPLSTAWLEAQWAQGIRWALTDSGYVDRDEIDGLRALFRNAAVLPAAADFMLALPMDTHWVSEHAPDVRRLVEDHGLPVAYMLGADRDPLATRAAVEGLLLLLESPVPSVLLRTDQSAIGALAAGASMSAMGTSSALRHIFPPRPGGPRPRVFSVLVPQTLSHHGADILAATINSMPEETYWWCPCAHCQYSRLDDILDPDDAFAHNVHAITEIARHVMDGGDRAQSLASWRALCEQAKHIHSEIAYATGKSWSRPRFLTAWTSHLV
ncbi:hypothetical protein [Jiangella endophytica]|uniref:hypothetical protein n=1 Tax=Jiangella endophytica TaxID=1623398 RepID=UPI000E3542C6|nr:hypothetical protein [Jiangella endophytica]